jgi:hypothetical protein
MDEVSSETIYPRASCHESVRQISSVLEGKKSFQTFGTYWGASVNVAPQLQVGLFIQILRPC